jgi:hypothetical protein
MNPWPPIPRPGEIYAIVHRAKSSAGIWVALPMVPEAMGVLSQSIQVDKRSLAEETIDGHPCVKRSALLTDTGEPASKLLIWNGADLRDFPIQIQGSCKGGAFLMRLWNVRFTKPDAGRLDPPPGYKELGLRLGL